MKLSSLEELYRSMKAQSLEMQQFPLKHAAVTFDCLFSTREAPFILTLTSQGVSGAVEEPKAAELSRCILEIG